MCALTQLPAEFRIDVFPPDMLQGGTQVPADARPCELLLARITAHATGVPLATRPKYRGQPGLLGLAEHVLGWAGPAETEPAPIPFDLIFERVYLGGIPSSTLPLAAYVLLTLGASLFFYRVFQNLLARTEEHEKDE